MNENELITLVHKYCVYQSFDKFGWLFTSYVPEKPRIGLTNKMMISVVMNKLQNTFTDQNKQLFKNMLATLKNWMMRIKRSLDTVHTNLNMFGRR